MRIKALLDRFVQVRRDILETLEKFPVDKVGDVVFGKWSLKDVLSHLVGWDSYFIEIVILLKAGKEIRHWGSLKKFNEGSVKKREDWSWNDVYIEFFKTGEDFIKQYRDVDEGLMEHRFWKNRSYTPARIVNVNIHHYTHHLEKINERLKEWE